MTDGQTKPSGFDGGAREPPFRPDRRNGIRALVQLRLRAQRDPIANAAEIRALTEQIDALEREDLHREMGRLGLHVEHPHSAKAEKGPGVSSDYFPGDKVGQAVKELSANATSSQRAIAKRTMLSRAAVRRIFRLIVVGVFVWDFRRGWLGIDGDFRATWPTINLRDLEKLHGLDPLT